MLSGQLEERTQADPMSMVSGQDTPNLGLEDLLAAMQKAK